MGRGFLLKQKLEENSAITRKRSESVRDTKHKPDDSRKRRKVVVKKCAMKDQDVLVDYTSLLPEPVLHHILSYLSVKDAARASVLSKRWRQARDTSHIVVFDQRCFDGPSVHAFQKYVNDFFQRRLELKYDIQIFKLAVEGSYTVSNLDIAKWLNVVVKNNVKEIDLHMPCTKFPSPFIIPSFVLATETLTAITLRRCMFGLLDGLNLPNLRKLCLKRIRLTDDTLRKLTSNCPSIEWLSLISCNGMENLEVSTLELLNRFEVHFCKGIRKVEIMAPRLESFWFYRYKDPRRTAINLVDCSSLKKLSLEDPFMDDLTFDSLILKYPILEHLVLSKCNALKKIKISLAQLKSLVVRGCKNLIGGEFHVPQLVSFEYSGVCNMLFSLFNSSSLRKAKLQFGSYSEDLDVATRVQFCLKVYQFLSSIDQSSGLKLVARHKKKIAVYQHWRHFKLPMMLPNMMFEIIKPSMKLEKLLNYLIQTYQPETISLVADAEWQKILSEKVINQVDQRDKLNCCTYNTRKCWRHYLKGTSIKHFTSPADINDDLNTWTALVEAEELPSTTINLAWETHQQPHATLI